MHALLAIAVGGLFGFGLYLMLRRSLVRLLIGLSLVSHAANLLLLGASGPLVRNAPLVPDGAETLSPISTADPLPQALILTAIVISFGVVAFAIVLVHRVSQTTGTDDVDELKATDR